MLQVTEPATAVSVWSLLFPVQQHFTLAVAAVLSEHHLPALEVTAAVEQARLVFRAVLSQLLERQTLAGAVAVALGRATLPEMVLLAGLV